MALLTDSVVLVVNPGSTTTTESTHCALVAGADERGRILLDLCGDETGRALDLITRTSKVWLPVKTVLAEFKGGAGWDWCGRLGMKLWGTVALVHEGIYCGNGRPMRISQ